MEEDVGTVELCVIYSAAEKLPQVIDATFLKHDYGK